MTIYQIQQSSVLVDNDALVICRHKVVCDECSQVPVHQLSCERLSESYIDRLICHNSFVWVGLARRQTAARHVKVTWLLPVSADV